MTKEERTRVHKSEQASIQHQLESSTSSQKNEAGYRWVSIDPCC